MHSILVLGDTRTHSVVTTPPEDSSYSVQIVHGGARLMMETIASYLEPVNAIRRSKKKVPVKLLGYDPPSSKNGDIDGQMYNWQAEETHLEGVNEPLWRLKRRGKFGTSLGLPRACKELRKTLKTKNTAFHNTTGAERSGTTKYNWPSAPTCPHIIVLDDLNEFWRTLRVDHEPECARKYLADKFTKSWVDVTDDEKRRELECVLSLLVERLETAKNCATKGKIPIMEPVIVASIRFALDNALPRDSPHMLMPYLHADPWLSERTIILLSAGDLRDAGLAVSTGLSWERTAQDTIAEMQRHDFTRRFLEFGQVVVRYGVTGALHIVKRGTRDWSYDLHFDPGHNDVAWSVPVRDGQVLGHTSLYAGSLVNKLVRNCENYDARPLVASLPTVISDAIDDAIIRCKRLSTTSYRIPSPKTRLEIGKIELPKAETEGQQVIDAQMVSIAPVPPILLRDWSILSQSAQTYVGAVAQDIVRFGASQVLNQPYVRKSDITRLLLRKIAENTCKELEKTPQKAKAGIAVSLIDRDRRFEIYEESTNEVWKVAKIIGTRSLERMAFLATIAPATIAKGVAGSHGKWEQLDVALKEIGFTKLKMIADALRSPLRALSAPSRKTVDDLLGCLSNVVAMTKGTDVVDGSFASPLVRFGRTERSQSHGGKSRTEEAYLVVDRREIEGFRAIQKLMRSHIDQVKEKHNKTPLAIAVFGPPGSGKSTAVKKINESLDDDRTVILPAFNISQFSNLDNLKEAFEKIMEASLHDKVPIAFFDEFDSRFPSEDGPLGWLKYFLAPMEDGTFLGKTVKNAILVFAGGTNNTFEDFSLEGRSKTDEQWIAFSKAKGPDFVSRLRGHLNIVGINPVEPDDELYLIRRALLIRSLIGSIQNLADGDKADIDEDMLRAILHVPLYRHGGRAVRMLLELCQTTTHRISASAVPPIHQLNMLVDGKAFLDLLMNVSAGARVVD